MVFSEMLLKSIVVDIVLLVSTFALAITDMASFMSVSAVSVELVFSIESLPAESTFWMSFETALIDGAWIIVSVALMLSKFGLSKQLMLMGEDLFVSCTKFAFYESTIHLSSAVT